MYINMVFDKDRFELRYFYSYPSVVINRISEYEENGFRGTHGDLSIKTFFEDVLKEARNITGKHLMDNKIAFEIFDKENNETLYVGYKDNIWCIGERLNPYLKPCYILDLKTFVKSLFPCTVL